MPVIVDLHVGEQAWASLNAARHSPSNKTAVMFAISGSDAEAAAAFRKGSGFVFERPLSMQAIRNTLKPAYGLILRERRRYFRCPVATPTTISRQGIQEVRCYTLNVSEGGMAVSTSIPITVSANLRYRIGCPKSWKRRFRNSSSRNTSKRHLTPCRPQESKARFTAHHDVAGLVRYAIRRGLIQS
jgi:hypothetical protein